MTLLHHMWSSALIDASVPLSFLSQVQLMLLGATTWIEPWRVKKKAELRDGESHVLITLPEHLDSAMPEVHH